MTLVAFFLPAVVGLVLIIFTLDLAMLAFASLRKRSGVRDR